MIVFAFLLFTGTAFAYIGWRNIRLMDLRSEDLFSYLFMAPIVFLVSSRLAHVFLYWGVWELRLLDIVGFWRKSGYEIFVGYVCLLIYTIYFSHKKGWKILYFLEDIARTVMIFLFIWCAYQLFYLEVINLWNYAQMVSIVLTLMADTYIRTRYRRLWWYPSGKKGFMFFFDHFAFFLFLVIFCVISRETDVYTYLYALCGLASFLCLMFVGNTLTIFKKKI